LQTSGLPQQALGQNPNLGPGMLGGAENAGYYTDRFGNVILSPGAVKPPGRAKGGPASDKELLALLKGEKKDAYAESLKNFNSARSMLEDLSDMPGETTTEFSSTPISQTIRRATRQPIRQETDRGTARGMAMELESLTTAQEPKRAPDTLAELLKMSESVRSRDAMSAKDLMRDTFGTEKLTKKQLARLGDLMTRRFAEGGEAKRELSELEARQEYLRRNPQYATPEPGLEPLYPELFALARVGLGKMAERKNTALAKKAYRQIEEMARKKGAEGRSQSETSSKFKKILDEMDKRPSRKGSSYDRYKAKKPSATDKSIKALESASNILRISPATQQALGILPDAGFSETRQFAESGEAKATGELGLFTALAQKFMESDTFKKMTPLQVRTFLESTQGLPEMRTMPISEKNLDQEEQDKLRSLIEYSENLLTDPTNTYYAGKRRRRYYDTPGQVNYYVHEKFRRSRPGASPFSEGDRSVMPSANLRNTLGNFSFERLPDGTLVVKDAYDFTGDIALEDNALVREAERLGVNRPVEIRLPPKKKSR
jgi:hypothetical protein